MYFDLYLPFPLPLEVEDCTSKKSKKGKGKAVSIPTPAVILKEVKKDCWSGIEPRDKEVFVKKIALSGHLGYSVVACTVTPSEPSNQVIPSPFMSSTPFPDLDPRTSSSASDSESSTSPLVQVTRYHMRIDDNRVHPLTSQNTNALKNYDILSVYPTSEKAFQLACTDLSNPGPNQIAIITLPLHERPFTFRFNWKQMRQAQRNGAVFELLYSSALFPPTSLSTETVKRYRQNFLSNAREVIRITGGKGVIFSSGPGGDVNGLRGALDIVNLGTMIGIPSNLAKETISSTPKSVLLRAQARKTFKAVMSMPKLVPAPDDQLVDISTSFPPGKKRPSDIGQDLDKEIKKSKVSVT
ncbi:uncharacterized protein IL334_004055 [Kwoniella shivajii]|uniref:Uncharacterized protein n=1 Tax=Kwoniella shivajii TaxID=564305 RepID=A0ABZ1CZ98_9TREE|nr:hypothetical protein IL334_004055 [Kwoniella shivajii]